MRGADDQHPCLGVVVRHPERDGESRESRESQTRTALILVKQVGNRGDSPRFRRDSRVLMAFDL